VWKVEEIPDRDSLFFRIHKCHIGQSTKKLKPKVFQERGTGEEKGMSTDWEKHSNAEQLRLLANKPDDNGVVSLITGFLRGLELDVIHAPIKDHPDPKIKDNRSHTNVTGIDKCSSKKQTEIRTKLLYHIKWEILPPVSIDITESRH